MTQDQLDHIRSLLKRDSSAKVLIVGGRGANFSKYFREHPRLMFWDSTDPQTSRRTRIPAGVRIVIFTRFIGHKISNRIKSLMPEDIILVRDTMGTGEIKDLLVSANIVVEEESAPLPVSDSKAPVSAAAPNEIPTEASAKTAAATGESLSYFMSHNANTDADVRTECRRLLEIVSARGLSFKFANIRAAFYQLRRRRELRRAAATTGAAIEIPAAQPQSQSQIDVAKESTAILREFINWALKAAIASEKVLKEYDRLKQVEVEYERLKKRLEDQES